MAKWTAVTALAIGAVLFVMGLHALLGASSGLLSAVGVGLVLAGAATLAATQTPLAIKPPHIGVAAIAAAALVLHAIECFAKGQSDAAWAFLVWGMTPYVLSLIISSVGTLRVAPVVGSSLALTVDGLVHFEVFMSPQSSTSPLLLIFAPLWNDLVIVPLGTIVAWLLLRRRSRSTWPQP